MELRETNSETKRKKLVKRLKLVESFLDMSNSLPGMDDPRSHSGDSAPELRPLVPLGWWSFCDLGPQRSLSSGDQS